MSNHFCTAKHGRILEISIECWELLSDAFDDDLLTVEQDEQYLRLWNYIQDGEWTDESN